MANDARKQAPSCRGGTLIVFLNAAPPLRLAVRPSGLSTPNSPALTKYWDYDDAASRFFTPSRTSGISSSP